MVNKIKKQSQRASERNSSSFRSTVPFLADPAPFLPVCFALQCSGNTVQNVQMHQALPDGLTYSSTHGGSQPGYGEEKREEMGWGGVVGEVALFTGKGNKGPLCPVGVGLPLPWTQSPLTEICRGEGIREGDHEGWVGLSCDRGQGSLFTFKFN